jgi:hypothetical protein
VDERMLGHMLGLRFIQALTGISGSEVYPIGQFATQSY